jgi:hypothetical protein
LGFTQRVGYVTNKGKIMPRAATSRKALANKSDPGAKDVLDDSALNLKIGAATRARIREAP